MLKEPVIVSILQVKARRNKEDSMRAIENLARRAIGDILVMPEYAMVDPTDMDSGELYSISEGLDGEWIEGLKNIARSLDSCIVGSLFERSPQPPLVYNTIVFINKKGELIGSYRKTHLFDVLGYKESEKILAGSSPPKPLDLCGVKIGYAICFEIRYPELFRLQALEGVDVFIVPSAWYTGHGKEESYRFLAQSRAHENTSYLVAPILFGERFTGRSLVVDPYGVVVAEAGFGERLVEVVLDPEVLREARSKLPLLRLRRSDLYRIKWTNKK